MTDSYAENDALCDPCSAGNGGKAGNGASPHVNWRLSTRDDSPPDDIYWNAVPIWCGYSHDELAERLGEEYACGFAYGFERGIIMAMLRPEWAQGLYLTLRQHYLTTHTEEDPDEWERHANETALASPIHRMSLETA